MSRALLNTIERAAFCGADGFERGRGEARYLLELGREVRYATVVQIEGYLGECLLTIYDQFFSFLDALLDEVVLNCAAFY